MLTTNVDVTDGLVNGARGEVVHVVSDNDDALTHILVKFDHPNVGIQAKLRSQFGQQYPRYESVEFQRHHVKSITIQQTYSKKRNSCIYILDMYITSLAFRY